MLKVNNKNTRTKSMTSVPVFLLLALNAFTPFSSDSIIEFEQVNICRVLIVFQCDSPFQFYRLVN